MSSAFDRDAAIIRKRRDVAATKPDVKRLVGSGPAGPQGPAGPAGIVVSGSFVVDDGTASADGGFALDDGGS